LVRQKNKREASGCWGDVALGDNWDPRRRVSARDRRCEETDDQLVVSVGTIALHPNPLRKHRGAKNGRELPETP